MVVLTEHLFVRVIKFLAVFKLLTSTSRSKSVVHLLSVYSDPKDSPNALELELGVKNGSTLEKT